ncbi:MAG: class I SAM-dependent methyltransferase [Clostridiales bacterium]|nr:class I SAM-dependent methyltransferase [Clostridiales bacterium]
MKTYENFARVYDELMDNVPYETWADYIQNVLKKYHIDDGLMLELGCGTGKMMSLMAEKGYDMIGVDSSVDMLQLARERTQNLPGSFLYLLQDMRAFELYGTVRSVISVCDSVNYITEEEDLTQVFRLVNNYLDPGGIFVFDFNTEYKYRDVVGDSVIAEDRDDVSFIWYNEYDEEEHLNYIDLSIFVQEQQDLFRKYQEQHIQKGYTLEQMKRLIRAGGLCYLEAYDEYTGRCAHDQSERIVLVAREQGKKDI